MLPISPGGFTPNLMWPEVVDAYGEARASLGKGAGILYEDRLRRNLLSSQPLCFNLFGFIGTVDANALLPWVRLFAPKAVAVSRVRLEYAPAAAELGEAPLGGSAFDAFVEYELPKEALGFVGIETKYHEDLAKGLRVPKSGSSASTKYAEETRLRPWRAGAADRLIAQRKNLQFWYNQLLAQRTFELVKDSSRSRRYSEFTEVVVACRQDESAKDVVRVVAGQLADGHQSTLRYCAIDELIDAVTGHEEWKHELRQRYTDFTPIQEHLAARSPLRLA